MGSYTIGRLAAAAGVHVETVRYYERRGLIDPPPRSAAGYRQYGPDDLWRLELIARGKQLGFTLAEIADLVSGPGTDEAGAETEPALLGADAVAGSAGRVLARAQAKLAAIDERQRELAGQRCRLEQLTELCRTGAAADCVALRVVG